MIYETGLNDDQILFLAFFRWMIEDPDLPGRHYPEYELIKNRSREFPFPELGSRFYQLGNKSNKIVNLQQFFGWFIEEYSKTEKNPEIERILKEIQNPTKIQAP